MAHKKVDKLITFEVAKLITLERPKGGQTNNSGIYIYVCWTATRKPVQGPQKLKNAAFSRMEPFWLTVQGPPNSQLEGHRASLKMRRECGPWTGSLVGPELAFNWSFLAHLFFPSFFKP